MGYKSRIPSCLLRDCNEVLIKRLLSSGLISQEWTEHAQNGTLTKIFECFLALVLGHPTVLRYRLTFLIEHERSIVVNMAHIMQQVSTSFGNMKCVKLLQKQLMWSSENASIGAALMGDLDALRYFDAGILLSVGANTWIREAIRLQHLDVLDWALERKYIIKRGFLDSFINVMTPVTLAWYFERFGVPSTGVMNKIRTCIASRFLSNLMPYLDDVKNPYPGQKLTEYLFNANPFYLLGRSIEATDVGALLQIAIGWKGCVHDYANRVGCRTPRVATAILRLMINLGLPTSCSDHPEAVDLDEFVRNAPGNQHGWGVVQVMNPPGPFGGIALPDKAQEEEPKEPISPLATNEELVAIINAEINQEDDNHIHGHHGLVNIGSLSVYLDDEPEPNGSATPTKVTYTF